MKKYGSSFSSVALSCPTLCNPMNHSTPGLPVHHQLLEFTQTHVHRVGDVIPPSHPMSSPLLPPSIFPSIRVSSNESALHIRWPKYWSFSFNVSSSSEHPGLISFRMDWLDLLAVLWNSAFRCLYLSCSPLPLLLHHVRLKEGSLWSRSLPDAESAGSLILNFPELRTMRNKICCSWVTQ